MSANLGLSAGLPPLGESPAPPFHYIDVGASSSRQRCLVGLVWYSQKVVTLLRSDLSSTTCCVYGTDDGHRQEGNVTAMLSKLASKP